jgi:hypothetical protein
VLEYFEKTVYWEEEDYTTVYKNIACPSYYSKDKNIVLKNKTNRTCVEASVSLIMSSTGGTHKILSYCFGFQAKI